MFRFSNCGTVFCNLDHCFVLNRILSACKIYALSGDMFHVAACLSSRFLTRSDVKEIHLAEFLDWACNVSEHFLRLKYFLKSCTEYSNNNYTFSLKYYSLYPGAFGMSSS